ncbi:integrase/recombinase [Choristoneura biennis entomopoxvirus 'L' virophage]|nr:integrase/recombinase [Choristoneura biennis entomopoxvirus 'L' virophage]
METININKAKMDEIILDIKFKTKIRSPRSVRNFTITLGKVFRYLKTDIDNFNKIDKSTLSFDDLKHLAHPKHYCFLFHILKFIFKVDIIEIKKLIDTEYKEKPEIIKIDYISTNTLDKLYECANDKEKLIMMILLSTGMRSMGLCNIKKENINFENNEIKTIEKNNKVVTFSILHDKIKELIIKTKLFDKPLKYTTLRNHIERLKIKSNLTNKNIHLHAFRHTFARLCLYNNLAYEDIKDLMNHNRVETTKTIYIKERNTDISKRVFRGKEHFKFPLIWKDLDMIKV